MQNKVNYSHNRQSVTYHRYLIQTDVLCSCTLMLVKHVTSEIDLLMKCQVQLEL